MPDQPPQNATYGHDGTEPAPTDPPTLNGPQAGTQGRKGIDPSEVADRKRFGANVRTRRVALGLTQTELAERMAMAGMDEWRKHIISRVERGSRGVTQDEVLALEDILDVNLCTSDDWETVGVPALMAEVRRLRSESNDRYADGYASAKRYYGDSAPITLDKIRDRLNQWDREWGRRADGTPIGNLLDDLTAILDTAQEPDHA